MTPSRSDQRSQGAGLGYYRRAGYLLDGARHVMEKCGGEFPSTARELQRIPGALGKPWNRLGWTINRQRPFAGHRCSPACCCLLLLHAINHMGSATPVLVLVVPSWWYGSHLLATWVGAWGGWLTSLPNTGVCCPNLQGAGSAVKLASGRLCSRADV